MYIHTCTYIYLLLLKSYPHNFSITKEDIFLFYRDILFFQGLERTQEKWETFLVSLLELQVLLTYHRFWVHYCGKTHLPKCNVYWHTVLWICIKQTSSWYKAHTCMLFLSVWVWFIDKCTSNLTLMNHQIVSCLRNDTPPTRDSEMGHWC